MNSIFVFRKDLRLEDNTTLNIALSSSVVLPIFIFDPRQIEKNDYKSNNAIQFMVNSLQELDKELRDKGSRLFVFYGNPKDIIEKLLKKFDGLYFNKDYTPFALKRDEELKDIASSLNKEYRVEEDSLINGVNEVLNNGRPYRVFTPFYNKAIKMDIRKPWTVKGEFISAQNKFEDEIDFNKVGSFYKDNKSIALQGGRDEALSLIEEIHIKSYALTRDIPIIPTSTLSAHLKFGTISVREVLHKWRGNEAFCRQLYWRDFWAYITFHFPKVLTENFYNKFDEIKWRNIGFDSWAKGETGFPIIDAGMRELNNTGFMHNRVRMLTASFLTKHLMIDWRKGARYFAQHLVDYCPMQNQNNWQSISGTGASALPWFRVMNPWIQQEKFDPNCEYIRKWIPELGDVPIKDIHNWFDSCVKYRFYTRPIVEHKTKSKDFLLAVKKLAD